MEPADEIITPHEIAELKAAGYVVVPERQFREYEEALREIYALRPGGTCKPGVCNWPGVERLAREALAEGAEIAMAPALAEAARRLTAAYDPENPSNLIGMMYPHDGELREIVEAEFVGAQMQVRLAPQPGDVRVTIRSVPTPPP